MVEIIRMLAANTCGQFFFVSLREIIYLIQISFNIKPITAPLKANKIIMQKFLTFQQTKLL